MRADSFGSRCVPGRNLRSKFSGSRCVPGRYLRTESFGFRRIFLLTGGVWRIPPAHTLQQPYPALSVALSGGYELLCRCGNVSAPGASRFWKFGDVSAPRACESDNCGMSSLPVPPATEFYLELASGPFHFHAPNMFGMSTGLSGALSWIRLKKTRVIQAGLSWINRILQNILQFALSWFIRRKYFLLNVSGIALSKPYPGVLHPP